MTEPRMADGSIADTSVPGALERWWSALVTSALVGTARTQPPPMPLGVRPREGGSVESAMLDAASIGGVLLAAGRAVPDGAAAPETCPPDVTPPAPERAVQLLRLALDQPPMGRELAAALVQHWCHRAAERGGRLPHELLPAALHAATQRPELRAALTGVLDERGRWLAAHRPEWSWVHGAAEPELSDDDWSHLTAAEQPAALRRIRAQDPDRGRAIVERELASAGAKQRVALLEPLEVGLGPADEPILEASLDDRAATVRAVARLLLDGLPESARGARLATLLRDAVSVSGLVRKSLAVAALPTPDAAGLRDGLGDVPQGVRPQAWYLGHVVAGAPLSVLTQATGTDPAGVLALDRDDVLWHGLRRAVVARGDVAWARAMLEKGWDAALAAVLPRAEREAVAARGLRGTQHIALSGVADVITGRWGPELSVAAADQVAQGVGTAGRPETVSLPPAVVAALHPDAGPGLQRALATSEAAEADAARALARRPPGATPPRPDPDAARQAVARQNVRTLRDAVQYLSLIGLVDEALT